MDLDVVRQERRKWLTWKNIVPYQEAIKALPEYNDVKVTIGDVVDIQIANLSSEDPQQIRETALLMKPWRKGPFRINELFIDSEWQSQIKYNLLEPHFDLEGKVVGDIGCNNGYYLFRMLSKKPENSSVSIPPPSTIHSFSSFTIASKVTSCMNCWASNM